MSDFFSDDFTAELKLYFLGQFAAEITKYIESSEQESWPVFRDEIIDKSAEWIIDAKTNEFVFFAGWFEQVIGQLRTCESLADYTKALNQVQAYLEFLLHQKKDDESNPGRFEILVNSGRLAMYLHCRIGQQDIVLPVHYVVEVIRQQPIFAIPQEVKSLHGLIPYRGEAIPIFNLQFFGFQMASAGEKEYFVICDVANSRFALQVSQADYLVELSSRDLQEKAADDLVASFISHFVIKENKNMMVFNLENLVAA